ncbi:MAG: hypothetical protein KDK97_25100, partial [Verrucomicrobiales bacterium]|nr:hypothetical protein [Verrucomicrobiales bacterium]
GTSKPARQSPSNAVWGQNPAPGKLTAVAHNRDESKSTVPSPSEEPTSSTPWSIIVVLIVAAIGLLWLLLKRRS